MMEGPETLHVPILAKEIVEELLVPFQKLSSGEEAWFIDATFGGGGHTGAFLEAFREKNLIKAKVLAFDQDGKAIERGQAKFKKEIEEGRLKLVHAPFSEIGENLNGKRAYALLADLGLSSDQLADSERGFSFQLDSPLDMRMNPERQEVTALSLLRDKSMKELQILFQTEGEEPFSGRIARVIVEERKKKALPRTTQEFVELILSAVPPFAKRQKIHPATRVFQALRREVNQEGAELDALLNGVLHWICSGGRVGIISFHSGEDRKVKGAFRNVIGKNRKPIIPTPEEITQNPRSRSAKLRFLEIK